MNSYESRLEPGMLCSHCRDAAVIIPQTLGIALNRVAPSSAEDADRIAVATSMLIVGSY